MVKYEYDAWGECVILHDTATLPNYGKTLGNLNPIRYKGYYYDTETNLYYLVNRYYDPATGRFISSDSTNYLDFSNDYGINLFAYCNNNPVMGYDPMGKISAIAVALILIGSAILLAAQTLVYGAVKKEPVVLDISGSVGALAAVTGGVSFVIDFEKNIFEIYGHVGGSIGSGSGVSLGASKIYDYENAGDFAGGVINVGGGYYGGIDMSFNGKNLGVSTIGGSVGVGKGAYIGYSQSFLVFSTQWE